MNMNESNGMPTLNPAILLAMSSVARFSELNEADRILSVADALIFAKNQSREDSILSRLLRARQIRCTIQSVELEPTSSRLVVRFVAVNGDGKLETIRTDRVDGQYGEFVRALWRPFHRGGEAVIYKVNTPAPEGATGPHGEPLSHGYRNAVWVVGA